jgi:hypothetical protein
MIKRMIKDGCLAVLSRFRPEVVRGVGPCSKAFPPADDDAVQLQVGHDPVVVRGSIAAHLGEHDTAEADNHPRAPAKRRSDQDVVDPPMMKGLREDGGRERRDIGVVGGLGMTRRPVPGGRPGVPPERASSLEALQAGQEPHAGCLRGGVEVTSQDRRDAVTGRQVHQGRV